MLGKNLPLKPGSQCDHKSSLEKKKKYGEGRFLISIVSTDIRFKYQAIFKMFCFDRFLSSLGFHLRLLYPILFTTALTHVTCPITIEPMLWLELSDVIQQKHYLTSKSVTVAYMYIQNFTVRHFHSVSVQHVQVCSDPRPSICPYQLILDGAVRGTPWSLGWTNNQPHIPTPIHQLGYTNLRLLRYEL